MRDTDTDGTRGFEVRGRHHSWRARKVRVFNRRRGWDFLLVVRDNAGGYAGRDLYERLVLGIRLEGDASAIVLLPSPRPRIPWWLWIAGLPYRAASAFRLVPKPRQAAAFGIPASPETIISIMTSSGALMTIRSVVIQWLKQRKGSVEIAVEYPDGRRVSIKGDAMSDDAREEAVRAALRLAADQPSPTADEAGERPSAVRDIGHCRRLRLSRGQSRDE